MVSYRLLDYLGHFLTDMSNRFEHPKRYQRAKWPFGFIFGQTVTSQWPGVVFGVQHGYSCRLKSFQVNALNHVVFITPKSNTICLTHVPLLLA